MLKNLAYILMFCFSSCSYSQRIVTGLSASFYVDNLPPDIFGSANVGIVWQRFSSSLELTNCMGYRESSFQLIGIQQKVYFRPIGKIINGYVEFQGGRQISGKRTGNPQRSDYVPCSEQYLYYEGDIFLRANFQGSLNLGLAFCYKNVELHGGVGRSFRKWSSYKVQDKSEVEYESTFGLLFEVGLNYYFSLEK